MLADLQQGLDAWLRQVGQGRLQGVLRALIGVAGSGSYTAASRALSTSRMTLRTRVEALEAELGALLLVSSHRV